MDDQVDPDRHRDKNKLQNRFRNLWSVKKPTGDPTIPDDVRRAKRINYRINGKSQMVTMGAKERDEDGVVEECSEVPAQSSAPFHHP